MGITCGYEDSELHTGTRTYRFDYAIGCLIEQIITIGESKTGDLILYIDSEGFEYTCAHERNPVRGLVW